MLMFMKFMGILLVGLVACGGSAAVTGYEPATDGGTVVVAVDAGVSRVLSAASRHVVQGAGDAADVDAGDLIADAGLLDAETADASDAASDADDGVVDPSDASIADAAPYCATNAVRCKNNSEQVCNGTAWVTDDSQACCTDPGSRWTIAGERATDGTTGLVWNRDVISTRLPACSTYYPGSRRPTITELQGLGLYSNCQPAWDQKVFVASTFVVFTANDGVCFSFETDLVVDCSLGDAELCIQP